MPRERVIAALTIGPTAVMMLILRRYADGRWEYINELTASTGLAENLDEHAIFDRQAMRETVAAISAMYVIAAQEGVERVIPVGSNALEKAKNELDFIQYCRAKLNLSFLEILSAREESELSFMGATVDFPPNTPYLLLDLGGSSTEIAYGDHDHIEKAISIPIGYLHLTHRFFLTRFLWLLFKRPAERYIREELGDCLLPMSEWIAEHHPEVLVSGAIASSIVGLRNQELVMDRKEVHHTRSNPKEVWNIYCRVMHTLPINRPYLPGIERDRVRMIPGAFLMLYSLLKILKLNEFSITANGLRMGLIRRFEMMEETEQAFASLNQESF